MNTKNFLSKAVVILMMVATLTNSCSDDDAPAAPSMNITPAGQAAIVFAADGTTSDNATFSVTTNQSEWNAVSSQAWCIVTKTATGFTVSATANAATTAPAPATVTVTAGTATPIVINVTQTAASPNVSLTPAEQTAIEFAADGTTSDNTAFSVTTNQGSWDAVSNQTWCTVTKTANGFTVSATANANTVPPEPATVTVTAAEAAPVVINVTQADGIEMIFVQGGSAILNGTQVNIHNFNIGKYEVTQKQWVDVITTIPEYADDPWFGVPPTAGYGVGDNHPAMRVSWERVDIFINRLRELTGKNYRLPTEAEWEYAARGGRQSQGYIYSGSNDIEEVAWYYQNAEASNHEVGTKAANELGIHDMTGNLMEWCNDWYGTPYPSGADNPTGAEEGYARVIRGGSYGAEANGCTVDRRYGYLPNGLGSTLGFRVVCIP